MLRDIEVMMTLPRKQYLYESLYIDQDQKDHEYEKFLEIKQFLVMRLFLLTLIDSKLQSFKMRILVYLRMISSLERPSLMVF